MAVILTGLSQTWVLNAGVSVFGRGSGCEVHVADPRLSRRHAAFEVPPDGRSGIVRDLGSTNGVLVNGDRINGSANLRAGDVVVCGPVALTVAITDDPSPRSALSSATTLKPDPFENRTDAMEPLEIGGPRGVDPAIAAAISGPDPAGDHPAAQSTSVPMPLLPASSSALQPKPPAVRPQPRPTTLLPGEMPRAPVSALTSSVEVPAPAPDGLADLAGRPAAKLDPVADLGGMSGALQASGRIGPYWRGRRLLAGFLDVLTIALVADGLGGLLAVAGYGLALSVAGAGLIDGLPTLTGSAPASDALALAGSLFTPGGLERAASLTVELQRGHGGAFAVLFAAAALAVLVWVLAHLFYAIAATVLQGAPFWHRRFGLVIVRQRNGHFLGWGRATWRWCWCGLTLPLAALTAVIGCRGLHDLLAGSRVHDRRG